MSIKRTILIISLGFLYIAGIFAYDAYDKKTNYTPVSARILSFREVCQLRNPSRSREPPSDWKPCPEARRLAREDEDYKDYAVDRAFYLDVEYLSPADFQTHASTLLASERVFAGQPPVGRSIEVFASKTIPTKTRL